MRLKRNVRGVPATPRDFGFHVACARREPARRPLLARESPGYGVPVAGLTLRARADADEAVAIAREFPQGMNGARLAQRKNLAHEFVAPEALIARALQAAGAIAIKSTIALRFAGEAIQTGDRMSLLPGVLANRDLGSGLLRRKTGAKG
ncbi:MAG: hypothetical protein ACLQGP_29775 [Isosphaeraceae bacterium]